MNIDQREVAIQISGVKKVYKLGQIGGGTLQSDLQSWWARIRGKEDPNTKIGQEQRLVGQAFMALNGIDLTVYKGEALGIIGGNGAGKSTLLKLLSRVTAPTEGEIDIYGRVASMLEVGTGFNGEMTGRENIYMNGAILGMTKDEIDRKIDKIIEFSEVKDFIDTPVKRYSSGMYVKLAFSVAAHLDSEIMIMDEVLAVGDMKFQQKCLGRMGDAASQENRTVLYVSHNMNTIRQLCNRCVVLDQGKVIFSGAVEQAIEIYTHVHAQKMEDDIDLLSIKRGNVLHGREVALQRYQALNEGGCHLKMGEALRFLLTFRADTQHHDICFRAMVYFADDNPVAMSGTVVGEICAQEGSNCFEVTIHTECLAPGQYYLKFALYRVNEFGTEEQMDVLNHAAYFDVDDSALLNGMNWSNKYWGHMKMSMHVKKKGS